MVVTRSFLAVEAEVEDTSWEEWQQCPCTTMHCLHLFQKHLQWLQLWMWV